MKKEYNELFNRISPQSSNEEFLSQILRKAEKVEKKNKISIKKPVIAVFAAVLALTTATVTVGAATGWDFNGGFDAVFKNRTEQYSSEHQAYETGFDFAKYGKELDQHYIFDDYTLNIYGVIADKSTAYVMYDVVFDEDFDYKEKKNYTEWDMKAILETADSAMTTNDGNLIAVDGNRFTFYKMATSGKENINLVGNTLIFNLYRLERGIENSVESDELYSESQIVDCGITVEIPVDFPIYSPVTYSFSGDSNTFYLIDYAGGKEFYVEAMLEKIEISPLSCEFSFMTDIGERWAEKGDCYSLGDFVITYNDGTEIVFTNNSYSIDVDETGRQRYHIHLNQPIDPDRISSVTVGGTTIAIV
ncbi:MAG: DUF4179 domain-containing protein [Ruminiclostridium sp.]|nr:DUF4179 domain-containing protein [Ruminiclostridium sp.]